jgi:hypothetical protein
MRIDILLTCENHFHDSIISLRGGIRVHKTSLAPSCTTLWTRILYCSWNVKFDSFVLLAMSVAFWHSLDTETSFMCGPCNNLFILFVFHNYQYERPIMGGWIPQLWNTFLFTCLGFSTETNSFINIVVYPTTANNSGLLLKFETTLLITLLAYYCTNTER